MPRIITLLTDFGNADGYVGEMKGVLATSARECVVMDIAHDIAAHDVESGRLALARYWRRFPEGTVHVVVVDPRVGGSRAALAVESERRFLVGPDNGVLSAALLYPGARCVVLPVSSSASPTFHGRDVFAPAAAELGNGSPLDALGTPFNDPIILRTPEATRLADGVTLGTVIAIDRFGNVITNLVARRGATVEVAGRMLSIAHTYSDVPTGAVVALVGSSGLVEVAVRDGCAAAELHLSRGDEVILRHVI